jgi:hypothetical protein
VQPFTVLHSLIIPLALPLASSFGRFSTRTRSRRRWALAIPTHRLPATPPNFKINVLSLLQIFNEVGRQVCDQFIQGYNGTIFAYGQVSGLTLRRVFRAMLRNPYGLTYSLTLENSDWLWQNIHD